MRTVVAGLVAFCVAVVCAVLAGFGSGLTPGDAPICLALGALCGGAAWGALRDLPRREPLRGWAAWAVSVAFALFALRAFCWLVFQDDRAIAFLSPNNLGDLSLHFTFIRYLANGAPLWPENPIYAGSQLHYPIGVDLFNSLLTLAGADLYRSLVWVGLLGSLATGVALWRWGGAFALGGFLFNGGLAGFAIFATGQLADYQNAVDWKSIPLALFVTQRGQLYAIPVGLALLWSWRARLFQGRRGLPLWIEVLLYSTLPLFHLHTFLFLSAMLGFWMFLPAADGRPAPRWEVLRVGFLSLLPATALIWMIGDKFHSGSAMHFAKYGWLTETENPLHFWTLNFGAFPFLVAALLGWLWWRRKRPGTLAIAAVAIPGLLFFRAACFVITGPWAWDNTKLLMWGYLAVLPALWAMLRECAPWLRATACFALFFSGAVSLFGGLDASHNDTERGGCTLGNRVELDRLAPALRQIPITATFACLPTYNHPLLLLGRKVVGGYEGHLWSYGIDYTARFAKLERLLRGEPGWQARARQLHVDYLFWGEREQEKYGGATPWKSTAPVIACGPWGKIYDLRNIPSAGIIPPTPEPF